jgi:hypothetical protein
VIDESYSSGDSDAIKTRAERSCDGEIRTPKYRHIERRSGHHVLYELFILFFQISLLKSTIRELESSLSRERELNASRPLNAEYLTNILKSFLLSKSPSEQAKLVSVLCSILHFQSEDTNKICELWTGRVKPTPGIGSGGLIGWFLPPNANGERGGGENGVDYQQYKDGIGGLDIY